jgi:RinA family phage transcriptional activator
MRMPPTYFRVIEHELYNYDYTKEQVKAMSEDIIGGPPTVATDADRVQTNRINKPTEQKGIKLASNIVLLRMEHTIKAIDRALLLLDEDHVELFELRYRQKQNWRTTVCETGAAQAAYFRRRRELVYAVAVQMGYANP